ncbi:PspA/IM30 family protein [Aneurinibacillus aneurinilyticus]|jgi:phage shock protein A|uniref:PspA/IM30 family protein n=2 Tax=Aneurinibacillus aneurinilyticus TaxID=1391 RepID=A0A848CVC2_ANEAE|nr:PspA/IM30 family protein [Aneurinibacillus aneurinilyticus]ERI05197.1 PspA/IM30 family protein [Aneurinibacillus aneurinilyticus ATCC 12856]MCI1694117.1 PspA/IM30 family protein [Aneurinibacillus aneurinilyticus]MED0708141.1 PspA/IM30 family protein [Aneurinibacillus aneurinilyticus]MED0721506.1 PspA/IM30 family protein [Aneurinibacillus aneurinilyticus]MED0734026.1 PspA/IM30 family protein [Aneurinibacillus aneurinilyticus]
MSLFKRVRDITTATMHQVLDHVEDPVAMLNQYMRDMESEISKAELAIARQIAVEKKWKMMLEETEARSEKRERQARLAVESGDESIARRALEDKLICDSKKEEYQQQYESARQQTILLREQLQELKDKFYEMRNKKATLLARANAARASKQMNYALYSIDTENAAKGFSRIEERVMMMETEAEATRYMRPTYRSLEEQMRNEERNVKVEEALQQLKAERQ